MAVERPMGRSGMRAVVCKVWGGVDDLVVEDVAAPAVGHGDVLIRARAAGINFADTLIIAGRYQTRPEPPFIPGFEVAGEVIRCGAGVTACRPGDAVIAIVDYGAFAEEVAAPESNVYRLPAGVEPAIGAAFPIAYGTTHLALTHRAGLEAGQTLLVHGAAGGVGLTAVEVGKLLGATVIATATGEEKCAIARAAGADHTIDSRAPDLRERVKALAEGRGVDVVYDPVGGALFEASVRCTAPGGRMMIVGFASGEFPQIPANILMVKNIAVIGFHWGAYRTLAPDAMRGSMEELLRWLAEGRLKPRVSRTFPLADAVAALTALKERRTTGKVVLTTG
jgi:NADPH2:quinone reductase